MWNPFRKPKEPIKEPETDKDKMIEGLRYALETEHFNFRKFRGQWEEAQNCLNQYRNSAYEVLRDKGLVHEFYYDEVLWRYYHPDAPVKTIVMLLAEALVRSRKRAKELEQRIRWLGTEVPADRKKEVDAIIKRIREERRYYRYDHDVVVTMQRKINDLKHELQIQYEAAARRKKDDRV